MEQLRSLVAAATASTTLLLQLQRNVHFSLGGEELECTEDATLSIRSSPDAGGHSRHFLVSGGCRLTLEGDITLVNGRAEGGDGDGGSLLIHGATAVLRGVTIRNSFADGDGGGIASRDGSRLDLEGVTVSRCEAGRSGGGLFAEQSERLQISDSVFERNKADKGGAAIEYASENADSVGATIVATSFKGNVGKTTVSAKARITWICERGQYMPRTSGDGAEAFTGDLKSQVLRLRRRLLRERDRPEQPHLQRAVPSRPLLRRGHRRPDALPPRHDDAGARRGERGCLSAVRSRPVSAPHRPGGLPRLSSGELLGGCRAVVLRAVSKGRLLQ